MNDALSYSLQTLPELCLIRFSGPDAVSFLHAQLTHDIEHLPQDQARLAAYCTAKGRVLATLVVWKDGPQDVLALVRRDLVDGLVKRLRMFVLRSKVDITVTDQTPVGLCASQPGAAPPMGLRSQGVWSLQMHDEASLIEAPSAPGQAPRWWLLGKIPALPGSDSGDWQRLDIQAGLPWVSAATQDVFIPQTLNLDLIDGVSFRKGCYPGQEVVARSHYRGTVKRRMAYACSARLAAPPEGLQEGMDTFQAERGPTERGPTDRGPVGRLVNWSWDPAGGVVHALLEVQLADLQAGALELGRPGGLALLPQALPYSLQPDQG